MTDLESLRDEVRRLSLELEQKKVRRLTVEVQTAAERNRLLLSPDELIELTGLRRPSAQLRELRRRGWRFEASSNGLAVVSRAYAEARLGGQPAPAPKEGPRPLPIAG